VAREGLLEPPVRDHVGVGVEEHEPLRLLRLGPLLQLAVDLGQPGGQGPVPTE
jgi:hypothetical protein